MVTLRFFLPANIKDEFDSRIDINIMISSENHAEAVGRRVAVEPANNVAALRLGRISGAGARIQSQCKVEWTRGVGVCESEGYEEKACDEDHPFV